MVLVAVVLTILVAWLTGQLFGTVGLYAVLAGLAVWAVRLTIRGNGSPPKVRS